MIPIPYADENPAPSRSRVLFLLLLLNTLAVGFWGDESYDAFGFLPAEPDWYRWLTSQFLHGDLLHLAGNMWMLWIFGDNVAARLGRWFLPFYLLGGIAANGLHLLLNPGSRVTAIGASGAVCAVIGSYIVFFPHARMKCLTLSFRLGWRYSLSALWFGILYILAQFYGILSGETGIGYVAHLGGLFFGICAALMIPMPTGTGLEFSGDSGKKSSGIGSGESITEALDSGQEELAIHHYIQAVRRDPYIELPEHHQLDIADKLTEYGHPHLAKFALEKVILRHPGNPSAPLAQILLGYLYQAHFKDFTAAAEAYREAIDHPACPPETKKDAEERLKQVDALIQKTFLSPPQHGERYAILLEANTPLSADQLKSASTILGEELEERLGNQPGFLAQDIETAEAARLAEALERAGVPVVVIPLGRLLSLPAARLEKEIRVDGGGLVLGQVRPIAWKDCLLISAIALRPSQSQPKQLGLMEIDVERAETGWTGQASLLSSSALEALSTTVNFEAEDPSLSVLEIVTRNPLARHRWLAAPAPGSKNAAPDLFYLTLQEILLNAINVPMNAGAQSAYERKIPEYCAFKTVHQADAYLAWQIQLANLKRGK